MLRITFAVFACLLLGACSGWVSDERLLGEGDWAHLALNGRYKTTPDSGSSDRIILRSRPDGLIEGRNTNRHDKSQMLFGLVAIKGGSGDYFLSVDRSGDDAKGDQYFVVRVAEGRELEFFMPDCAATPPVDGMTKVPRWHREPTTAGEVAPGESPPAPAEAKAAPAPRVAPDTELECKFSTKDALMSAGLEAEKFLSANHIVEMTPFFGLEPDDEEERSSTRG